MKKIEEQKTRDRFRISVVEAIHGLNYDDAVRIESDRVIQEVICSTCGKNLSMNMDRSYRCFGPSCNPMDTRIDTKDIHLPKKITISRVLKAFDRRGVGIYVDSAGAVWGQPRISQIGFWKLTDDRGEECGDEEQSFLTIKKLLNILKPTPAARA